MGNTLSSLRRPEIHGGSRWRGGCKARELGGVPAMAAAAAAVRVLRLQCCHRHCPRLLLR